MRGDKSLIGSLVVLVFTTELSHNIRANSVSDVQIEKTTFGFKSFETILVDSNHTSHSNRKCFELRGAFWIGFGIQ